MRWLPPADPPAPVLPPLAALIEPRPLFPSVRAEVGNDSGPELEPTIDADFVLTRESFLRLILGEALR